MQQWTCKNVPIDNNPFVLAQPSEQWGVLAVGRTASWGGGQRPNLPNLTIPFGSACRPSKA